MKSIIVPLEFLKAIGEKPAPIRIYWIKWLAEYTDQLFKPDFVETFVKDMEGNNNLNLETIKNAYDFGIGFFEGGFNFVENKKVKKSYPAETMEFVNKVIDYLNVNSSSTYTNNKSNAECIASRINEGYTFFDFKRVIDNKCKQWLGTEQQKYLRPITLFQASKFENYLNEPQTEINGKQPKSTSAIAKLQSASAKAKSYFK
jgi:uncharacterized phage protein (TIGR02220 family)